MSTKFNDGLDLVRKFMRRILLGISVYLLLASCGKPSKLDPVGEGHIENVEIEADFTQDLVETNVNGEVTKLKGFIASPKLDLNIEEIKIDKNDKVFTFEAPIGFSAEFSEPIITIEVLNPYSNTYKCSSLNYSKEVLSIEELFFSSQAKKLCGDLEIIFCIRLKNINKAQSEYSYVKTPKIATSIPCSNTGSQTEKPNEEPVEVDSAAPVPGNGGIVDLSTTTNSEVTLSWTPAIDDSDSSSDLVYLVYYSLNDDINTVEDMENKGTPYGSFASDTNLIVKDLDTTNNTYYFNVLVKDKNGNVSAYKGNALHALSTIKLSKPILSSPKEDIFTALDFQWEVNSDNDIPGLKFEVSLGSASGLDNHVAWTPISKNLTRTRFSLNIEAGTNYYANVRVVDQHSRKGPPVTSAAFKAIPEMGQGGLMLSQNTNLESEIPKVSTIDNENRILIAGYLKRTSDDAAIWRFKLDGSLDLTFGTQGRIVWDSPANKQDIIENIKVSANGNIIVAGLSIDALGKRKPLLGKFDKNGQAISSFSPDGFKVLEESSGQIKYSNGYVIIDHQDRLVQLRIADGLSHDVFMMRHNAAGSFDALFGNAGFLKWDHSYAPVNTSASVKEYIGMGAYDSGFYYVTTGVDGGSTPEITPGHGSILKIKESNGSIAAAVTDIPCKVHNLKVRNNFIYFTGYKLPEVNYCWGRIDKSSFKLDTTYGNGGTNILDASFAGVANRSYSLAVNSTDEMYLAGWSALNGYDGQIIKIGQNGNIDSQFGKNGAKSYSDLFQVPNTTENCRDPILLPNNSMYVIGYTQKKIGETPYYRIFIQNTSQ